MNYDARVDRILQRTNCSLHYIKNIISHHLWEFGDLCIITLSLDMPSLPAFTDVTPQFLKLRGIVITRGERTGSQAGGVDACMHDN